MNEWLNEARAYKAAKERNEKKVFFFNFQRHFLSLTNKIYGWILKKTVHMLGNLLASKTLPTSFSGCLSLSHEMRCSIFYVISLSHTPHTSQPATTWQEKCGTLRERMEEEKDTKRRKQICEMLLGLSNVCIYVIEKFE